MGKFFKRAGCLILPVVAIAFVVLLKWESLGYFALSRVVHHYADRAEIKLATGPIHGSLFKQTIFERVAAEPASGALPSFDFTADSITCSYNLWDLKISVETFLQGLHCSVSAPFFSYDFGRKAASRQPAEKVSMPFPPPGFPRFEVLNGLMLLNHADWTAEFKDVSADLGGNGQNLLTLQLKAENFLFSREGTAKVNTGVQASLLYNGRELIIESLKLGEEEITASGVVDFSKIDQDYTEFAADLGFAGSSLEVTGSVDKRVLTLRAETDNFDAGELQKRIGGVGWDVSGTIRGQADFYYNTGPDADYEGYFALEALQVNYRGVGFETLSAAGSFDNRTASLTRAVAEFSGNRLLVSHAAVPVSVLKNGRALGIMAKAQARFSAEIIDFEPVMELFMPGRVNLIEDLQFNSLTFKGSLADEVLQIENLRAAGHDTILSLADATIPVPATVKGFETVPISFTAYLESENLQNPLGNLAGFPLRGRGSASIAVSGTFKETRAAVAFKGTELLYKDTQLGNVSLKGEMDILQEEPGTVKTVSLRLNELEQIYDAGTLSLVDEAMSTWNQGVLSGRAGFRLDKKGEVFLEIPPKAWQDLSIDLHGKNIDSTGWLANFIDSPFFFHNAEVDVRLTDLLQDPQLQLSGTIEKAGNIGFPHSISGSFRVHYSSTGIKISEFSWESSERNRLALHGFLPYDPMAANPFLDGDLIIDGQADFGSLADIGFLLEPLGISRGSLVLDMAVKGSWDRPEGHLRLKAEKLQVPERLKQYMDSPINLTSDLLFRDGILELKSAGLESSTYRVEASGSWHHGISFREFLQQRRLSALQGEMSADAVVKLKDLNLLKNQLPWLRRLDGDMEGFVHLKGPVNNPEVYGSFSLEEGEVSHTFNFPTLAAVRLQAEFDRQSLTIRQMQAEIGGSPVNLDGRISRKNETVDIALHVEGKNVLLFRNNDMRMRGNVQLDVSGPLEKLLVKGSTGLTGGYYSKNFDFFSLFGSEARPVSEGVNILFSFKEPPLNNAVFDISISTIEPFRIRNNLIRGTMRPEIFLRGTGELPYLVGTIYLDPARVLLPSGRLQIQSGLLNFLENEPNRPQLDLVADSKVLGYDIDVVIQGPLDEPLITLNSSPPLPNDELLLLLLTGQPPQKDIAGGAKGSGATRVMVYLGRDFLNKWLEDESTVNGASLLDRFELDYGRDITRTGEQTIETSFRLSEQTAETGKIFYLTGEKDKYDAYNYGLKLVFRFE